MKYAKRVKAHKQEVAAKKARKQGFSAEQPSTGNPAHEEMYHREENDIKRFVDFCENEKKYSTGRECASNRKQLRKVNPARAAVENAEVKAFEDFILEKDGLPDTEQKKLYESRNMEKIEVFLAYYFFCIEVQQWVIKRNDLEVARMMLENDCRFAVAAHSTIVKFGSPEMWSLVLPVTKLCNEEEVNFAKKAPMPMLTMYRNSHDMCKKAENICRDVRKVKD